jgi:prepilin peptidase CpaA
MRVVAASWIRHDVNVPAADSQGTGFGLMLWPPPTPHFAVFAVVLAAAVCDVKNRRIPNTLTFGAAGVAVVTMAALNGWAGVADAALGWIVGLALFLPVFLLGGMGAGDVKLLAAIGAWLGPSGALWVALYGALAGGVLGLVIALAKGYTLTSLRNLRDLLGFWHVAGVQPVDALTLKGGKGPRLPYALPLAAGTIITLWMM